MKNKIFTFGQIFVLLFGIISISYAVGSEISFIEAGGGAITLQTDEGVTSQLAGSLEGEELNKINEYYVKVDGKTYTVDQMINTAEGKRVARKLPKGTAIYSPDYKAPAPASGDVIKVQGASGLPGSVSDSNGNLKKQSIQGADIPDQPSGGYEQKPGSYPSQPMQETKKELLETNTQQEGFFDKFSFGEESEKTVEGFQTDAGIGGHLITGIFQAGIAQQLTTVVARQLLGQGEEQAKVLGEAAGAGVLAGHLTQGMMEQWYSKSYSGNAGVYVGVAVAAYHIYENYKEFDTETVTFECVVWEPPKGGENCQLCNKGILECSEYQCKSLGKGCELLNPGTNEELCAWINRNDADAPLIKPWKDVLDERFEYTPDDTISPPDRGVRIQSVEDEGCVPAYTPLRFGIGLDEPATCKIDTERKDNYEAMQFYFGSDSLARYNHSHTMSLPSLNATGTVLESGYNMSLFVRCEDANGNANTNEFVFKFCVDEGEDFTPPLVTQTSISNNQPVAYNISEIDFTAYINEIAECKWDFIDKRIEIMENEFSCSERSEVVNAQIAYPCTTTLTGIKDREDNKFYIRCNDTSGNANKESYELNLIGTQPLYIDWAFPNETVKDSVSPAKITFEVKTSSGTDDGNAFCSYKPNDAGSYVDFLYNPIEMTYQHTQELYLEEGSYDYNIRCVDAGGNAALTNLSFDVETDISAPIIVRAYKEEGYLKLITNEAGECVYNTLEDIECAYEFEDGIALQTISEDEHFVEWNSQETYYIKCKDSFDNPPLFNDCSIVARPSEGEQI